MKLNEFIKEIDIESGEFKARMKSDMTWFDYGKMFEIRDNAERGVYTLKHMLVSWNIENDDGSIADINEENLKRLPKEIGIFLSEKTQELLLGNIEKKKSLKKK
jgi:hypothetical protein